MVWPYIVYKVGFKKNGKKYFIKYISYIIILLVSGGITGYLLSLVGVKSYIGFIIKLFICITIPNLIILLMFRRTKEMNYILKFIKNILIKILKIKKCLNKVKNIYKYVDN